MSHDQTTGGQNGELLSYCLLNSRLLVLWWAISCTKMSRWINECECYSKNITSNFVTTCTKVEVKPRQFRIGGGLALFEHQRTIFKLSSNMRRVTEGISQILQIPVWAGLEHTTWLLPGKCHNHRALSNFCSWILILLACC